MGSVCEGGGYVGFGIGCEGEGRKGRKEGRTTTRIVAQEQSVALPIMAAQSILVQRGGEDSPRCVVDRHAERAWVDLDERLGAVCAVSPMSGSAGSGGLGGVAVGHGGATYVGGGSSKEGVGGIMLQILLIYLLAPRRQGWVGVGGFGRIMARKDIYMGEKGWSAKATGDARRWTIEGMEGRGAKQ